MKTDMLSRLKTAVAALPRALSGDDPFTGPPPGAATEIGRLLWTWPRPLIHPDARLLVIHSEKAASTNVFIWYLHQLGHAKAARDFHNWPHYYMNHVLYSSELYRGAYDLDFATFTVARVVRDPAERAASGFRHALRHGFANAAIARRLGYRDIASRGLSFSMFLDFLEQLDLTTCNPHFSVQRHPIEDRLPVHHLINVTTENLFDRLNEVEAAVGLPRSDMAADPWVQFMRHHHRPAKTLDDADDLYTRPLTQQQANRGPWPRYEALLTPEARERIARLYAADIKAYLGNVTTVSSEFAS